MLKAASELTYAVLILAALRHRFGLLRPRLDLELWITTLRQSVPLFINGLARAVMMSSGLLLIGVAVDRHAVGLYAAAHRPVMVAAAVSGFLLVSFLASYSAAGRDVSTQIFRRTVWLGAAAAPLALAVSIASGPLVTLVYGASYAAAAPVLALLIWAVPITLAGGPYGIALIAANHQTRLLRNNVLGAAFTVAATLAVVPATGIAGAAAVVVAAQALVVVLNYATSVPLGVAPALGVVLFAPARARRAA
jgi:O-antigen/teichoic acid export membrane protein